MTRALDRFKVLVALDARCDDDAGENADTLAFEVDCIDGLRASQLVDRKRVAVNTASTTVRIRGGLIPGSIASGVQKASA